jgi:molybdopterin converting factor small subunit
MLFLHIKVKLEGIFHINLMKKNLEINLKPNAFILDLLKKIEKKIQMHQGFFFEGNFILLLNGRRIELSADIKLNEDDELIILSPTAGG